MAIHQKFLTSEIQIRKKKKHIKNEFRKTLSSLKILVFLARKIDTVGITKNKPITTGNTIKPRGNKRKCF